MRSTKLNSRTRVSITLAISLVAMFAIIGVGNAYAACSQPFDCFAAADGNQITGNQAPGGDSSFSDWQDVSVATADDPAKGSDTKFAGGDKETAPGKWTFITGNNTPKTDILEGWSRLD